jgi:hypothetical protein
MTTMTVQPMVPGDLWHRSPTPVELRGAMSDAAAASFYAAEQFGQYSPEHEAKRLEYAEARDRYEAACKHAAVAAYVTYDFD